MITKKCDLIAVGLILILMLAFVPAVSAVIITDSFNTSVPSVASLSQSVTTGNMGTQNDISIIFKNISAIAGVTEIKTQGMTLATTTGSKSAGVMAGGILTVPISLAGAGDSYSLTRATGTMKFTPISNISSYDGSGNPVYNDNYNTCDITITLDKPLVYKSGDTAIFRIYNRTSGTYTASGLFPSLTGFSSVTQVGYNPSSLNQLYGYIGNSGDGKLYTTLQGQIYGANSAISSTKYLYTFENIFSIDSDTLSWTMNKTISGKTTLSQFNITDGSGYVYYYPLTSNSYSGTILSLPVTINLTEPRYNTHISRTYFSGNYILSITPTSGALTDTFSAIFSDSQGNGINNLNGLNGIILYEKSSISEDTYQVVKDTSGKTMQWTKPNSTWYYWNTSTSALTAYGTTLPTSFSFSPANLTDVTLNLGYRQYRLVYSFTSGSVGEVSDTIEIISNTVYVGGASVPVTIIDATSGTAISRSTLASRLDVGSFTGTGAWYNRTSTTGKFYVNGSGSNATNPLNYGDVVYALGSATGYIPTDPDSPLLFEVNANTNGVTQYLSLVPSGSNPITGEFAYILNVYDDETTNPVSGVTVVLSGVNYTKSKTSTSAGIVSFYNLTSGSVYKAVISKTGYTSATVAGISGDSGEIVTDWVALSPGGINPTSTETVTPTKTGNYTSEELNEKASTGIMNFITMLVDGNWIYVGFLLLLMDVFSGGKGSKAVLKEVRKIK